MWVDIEPEQRSGNVHCPMRELGSHIGTGPGPRGFFGVSLEKQTIVRTQTAQRWRSTDRDAEVCSEQQ